MKKIIIAFLSLIFIGQISTAQPVSDFAVIPIGITIQPILRLNITRGGTMEFVFSKVSDITGGIANDDMYDTHLNIAASQNWDLWLETDNGGFVSDGSLVAMPIGVVNLVMTDGAGATNNIGTEVASLLYAAAADLQVGPVTILENATGNVGDATDNVYIINWACGDLATTIPGTAQGRYSINVFLSLRPE